MRRSTRALSQPVVGFHASLAALLITSAALAQQVEPPAQPPPSEAPPAAPEEPPQEAPSGEVAPEEPPTPVSPPSASAPEREPGTEPSAPAGASPSTPPAAAPPSAPVAPEPAPQGPQVPLTAAPAPPESADTPSAPVWPPAPALPEDRGVSEPVADDEREHKSRWRLSRLLLDQSVTTETFGVGQDYQSRNPTYDWTLQLRPRYYFIDRDTWSYSVQGTFAAAQELTNSDGTTRRRELDAEDGLLLLRYDRTLYREGDTITAIGLALPEVGLPISRASRNNGRVLGLGGALLPSQQVPLSKGSEFFPSFGIVGLARYQHFFTRATVPTNEEIAQPRTDLRGRPIVSDQLGSGAFPQHEVRLGFTTELLIHERVGLISDFQWRPTWNYEIDDDAQICNLLTGCIEADGVADPETYELITVFATEVETRVMDELSVSVGYINTASQIGPDGQRRSMFYSPNARFYLTLTAYLAEIFDSRGATPPSNLIGRVKQQEAAGTALAF